MESYGDFAYVYDGFMQDVPYENWARHIEKVWEKYNIRPKIVADLACGTGVLANFFAKTGVEVIGIDNSVNMLTIARDKAIEQGLDVLYLLQDIRSFELYGTVDSIYSTCDSMNYILTDKDLLQTFKWVNNYLEPGGIFIFDINSKYKYEEVLADNIFAYNIKGASYIWENYYDKIDKINEYTVTFFVEEYDGRYNKFQEIHYERMYEIDTVIKLLEKSGMQVEGIYDGYSFEKPRQDSERLVFIAKEKEKRGAL